MVLSIKANLQFFCIAKFGNDVYNSKFIIIHVQKNKSITDYLIK